MTDLPESVAVDGVTGGARDAESHAERLSWLTAGWQCLDRGDGEGARHCFRVALDAGGADALAWVGLGQSYLTDAPPTLGRAAEAFASALECDGHCVAAYTGLAAVAEIRGAWEEAHALWVTALSLSGDASDAYAGLVRYYERTGNGPEALAVLASWVVSGCADLSVLERLVAVAPAHDGIGLTLEVLAQLLERDSLSVPWLYGVGRAFQALGQAPCARVAYQRAVALGPDHIESWRALGHVHLEAGAARLALQAFETVHRLGPKMAEAAYDLAVAQLENSLQEAAIASFGRALQLMPQWVEARTGLGWALLQAGRFSSARACFELALSARPEHAPAWDGLGTTFWKLGQLDAAINAMQRASELTPFESGDGYRSKWGMLLTARAGDRQRSQEGVADDAGT